MEAFSTLPILSDIEIRVLGTLIEKSRTTPEYYPLTLNSLTTACNQKSSRKPITSYSEEDVQKAISNLKALSLVATAVGGGSRTLKFKHNFSTVYPIGDNELAILCLLLLRGPQTAGELNTNSGRLYEFSSIESVLETLAKMSSGEINYVKELAKQPGQKERRFMHLLTDKEAEVMEELIVNQSNSILELRLEKLECEVEALKNTLHDLIKELKG